MNSKMQQKLNNIRSRKHTIKSPKGELHLPSSPFNGVFSVSDINATC